MAMLLRRETPREHGDELLELLTTSYCVFPILVISWLFIFDPTQQIYDFESIWDFDSYWLSVVLGNLISFVFGCMMGTRKRSNSGSWIRRGWVWLIIAACIYGGVIGGDATERVGQIMEGIVLLGCFILVPLWLVSYFIGYRLSVILPAFYTRYQQIKTMDRSLVAGMDLNDGWFLARLVLQPRLGFSLLGLHLAGMLVADGIILYNLWFQWRVGISLLALVAGFFVPMLITWMIYRISLSRETVQDPSDHSSESPGSGE